MGFVRKVGRELEKGIKNVGEVIGDISSGIVEGVVDIANAVLGDKIADDILGLDPGGGGIVPVLKAALPIAAGAALGVPGAVSGALGGGLAGAAGAGAVTGALGASGAGINPLKGALIGGLTGGVSNLISGGVSAAGSLPISEAEFLAADAAQLAGQGIGQSQILDTLVAGGANPNLAQYAVNAIGQGLSIPDATQYIKDNMLADTQFAAADANQLYDQGLGTSQVENILSNSGNDILAQNLGLDADFIAADAQQLASQGLNPAGIQQNLIAAGVDPITAATVADAAATGMTGSQLTDLILDVSPDLTSTSSLFGPGMMEPGFNQPGFSSSKPSINLPKIPVSGTGTGTGTGTSSKAQGSSISDGIFGKANPLAYTFLSPLAQQYNINTIQQLLGQRQ